MLLVPKMDSRLVPDFDGDAEVIGQGANLLDYCVLGLPRQVLVKIKYVIILHSPT
jgi:hypothetical protein